MGPGADRLHRGLELARQRLGRASRPDQLYHLAAELHWIAWVSLRHREHLLYPQIIRCPPNRVNSIYLMGFNRGRRISDALAEVWQRRGSYKRARALIEAAITEDQIIGSDGGLSGINVMTMHKSKGKEFDGVIILHLGNNISPLSPDDEAAPHMKSRRLLRVGVTRAKQHVLMLTDAYSRSPLLKGHKLNHQR